jgi:hypothetical protein
MRVLIKKTKVMAFHGKYPITINIIIDNNPIEQISHFRYLGCDVMYRTDNDKNNNIKKLKAICGSIRGTLKEIIRQDT